SSGPTRRAHNPQIAGSNPAPATKPKWRNGRRMGLKIPRSYPCRFKSGFGYQLLKFIVYMKKLKNNKQKKYVIAGIILLIVFLLVGGVIFFVRAKNEKKETQARISETEKRETETLK